MPEDFLVSQQPVQPGDLKPIAEIPLVAIDEDDGINIADMSTSLPNIQHPGDNLIQDVNVNDDTDIVLDPPRRYPLRERVPTQKTLDNFRINAITNRDSVVCPTLNQALKSTGDQVLLWRAALMTELKTLQKLGTYEVVTKEEIYSRRVCLSY